MSIVLGAQTPLGPARIRSFQASPSAAREGEVVELRWSVTGTDWVRLEPGNQDLPSEGQLRLVVKQRTVFWLHASNPLGGQSMPLVVELAAPGPPPLVQPGPLPQRAAEAPAPPRAAAPAAKPAAPGVPAVRPAPPPGGVWIQFAALDSRANVEAMVRNLARRGIGPLAVFEIPDPARSEGTLLRVRLGPFPSIREARRRLVPIRLRVRPLDLHPIVATD